MGTDPIFLIWEILSEHLACRLADPIDVRVGHGRKERKRGDAAADALGVRELALAPAELAVELEQVHRGVVHADAYAVLAHPGDEARAREAIRQHDLEHVPVRLLEVRDRQLAAEAAVPE